jgi:hypothetical protein
LLFIEFRNFSTRIAVNVLHLNICDEEYVRDSDMLIATHFPYRF